MPSSWGTGEVHLSARALVNLDCCKLSKSVVTFIMSSILFGGSVVPNIE